MNRETFLNYLQNNVMILDGATGTQLQKQGMPNDVCPQQWVLEHPETIIEIQKSYIQAGSNAVYTCTFGGNRLKLEEYGLGNQVVEINRRLAQLSRQAVGANHFVVGDLAPTGQFVKPLGPISFEQLVDIYKEQVQGLLLGGVDFFVIETMMDIQEARAALLAVKESCDLPVCVSMTFNEDGRTLTGTDPVTALITLQCLGADAIGCNCSTGPNDMLDIIADMSQYASVPLLAKPNAGLPKLVDDHTAFDMDADTFADFIPDFIKHGVCLIGGCCGTTPEYIAQIKQKIKGLKPVVPAKKHISAVTSAGKTVFIGLDQPLTIVGERINPTGKKKLQDSLRNNNMEEIFHLALDQAEKGAAILDVNVGMPDINEKEAMLNVLETITGSVHTPLCLDSSSPEVLEAALRIYPGRALINSISAETEKLQKLLPIAAKYGAMFILLPIDDKGVPETAEERIKIINDIYAQAQKYGYTKDDIVVDGLVMTVSSNQKAAQETLKVIDWCSNELQCNTIIGLSNISFGLPAREWLNAAFLAMAIGKGLSMAIANPSGDLLMNIKTACDVLTSKDAYSKHYIHYFSQHLTSNDGTNNNAASKPVTEQIYDAVVKGNKDGIITLIEIAIKEGHDPSQLVDLFLIPAITQVGDLYEQRKYYLPQLILSAETMKTAFEYLEPYLEKRSSNSEEMKIKIVLATVKGDIHDIGKNIVGLMLKNHGFEVYDLGKDVSADIIIKKAKEVNAQIIGLSALMTTTMTEMKNVIQLAKQEKLECKFMVGGAVVTKKYADEIGADGYAKDAYQAVKLAKKLVTKKPR